MRGTRDLTRDPIGSWPFSMKVRKDSWAAGRMPTGIAQGQLSRVMKGKCGLSLRSIDLLCECLGLGLTAVEREGR